MKKELAILTTAALIFVTPVAANNNHNQGGNNSRHDKLVERLAASNVRVDFDKHREHPTSTPSGTPHPTRSPHPRPTPPASAPENQPSHGGFDCGKILERVFKNFNIFDHHNK